MAASVAVVKGQTDRGTEWNAGKDWLAPAGLVQPNGLGISRFSSDGSAEERRKQADDSLRKAMYISCWGPS
ncbi:hypothetical protein COCNU_06G010050 [Cocos nucifera]|uniref:Uncharacterized protein n=1 Tax=Cocos nucifera TaxID=13894 RepID=A0A8K0ICV1_COCNU|nr:hypothetical protein COCNU_06G010050 [Cocos nucifera]